jgi:hypothetical protein
MRKYILLSTAVLIIIILVGFGRKTDSVTFSGLVFSVNDSQVLVVQDIESAEIPYEEWFNQGKNAVFFTVDNKTSLRDANGKKITLDQMEAGQQVEVTFSGALAKSYPAQGRADRISIVKYSR